MAQDFFCGSSNLRPQINKQIQEDFVYCPLKCLQLGWPFSINGFHLWAYLPLPSVVQTWMLQTQQQKRKKKQSAFSLSLESNFE